jgi:hypothetical protein
LGGQQRLRSESHPKAMVRSENSRWCIKKYNWFCDVENQKQGVVTKYVYIQVYTVSFSTYLRINRKWIKKSAWVPIYKSCYHCNTMWMTVLAIHHRARSGRAYGGEQQRYAGTACCETTWEAAE